MKKYSFISVFTLTLFCTIITNVFGQTISGYVTDAKSGQALQGVVVAVFSKSETHFYETGLDGYYIIELYPGEYTISCSRKGYQEKIIENIKLEYEQLITLDIILDPIGSKSLENIPPKKTQALKIDESSTTRSSQDRKSKQIDYGNQSASPQSDPRINFKKIEERFIIGLGYQFGRIGGITGDLAIPFRKYIRSRDGFIPLFLKFSAGTELKEYQSIIFNNADQPNKFSFLRLEGGAMLLLYYNKIYFGPEFTWGSERAAPKVNNVHKLIDERHLRAFYLKPSLVIGSQISRNLMLNLSCDYYFIAKKTRYDNGKIVAYFDSNLSNWSLLRYDKDFFKNRNGIAFKLSINYLL